MCCTVFNKKLHLTESNNKDTHVPDNIKLSGDVEHILQKYDQREKMHEGSTPVDICQRDDEHPDSVYHFLTERCRQVYKDKELLTYVRNYDTLNVDSFWTRKYYLPKEMIYDATPQEMEKCLPSPR